MEIDEGDWAALRADVTVLRAVFLALLATIPAKTHIIDAFRRGDGRHTIEVLQRSGAENIAESALMQARAKLLLLMEKGSPFPNT